MFEGSPQQVLPIKDSTSNTIGYIVVDSTNLGPAMGGCRLWQYESEAKTLLDAQRLARGMSYKNAVAGLPLGGGKTVLRKPSCEFDRNALFRTLGRALNEFGGTYVTAEDVGTTTEDMSIVKEVSQHVFGLPTNSDRPGGDPSPWTAKGVFIAIQALADRFEKPLSEMTIAVQGVGSVGTALSELLLRAGSRLIVSDISATATARFEGNPSVQIVDNATIHRAPVDIYAPCALGAGLNKRSIPEINAKWIVGAANNQLEDISDGDLLERRGIVYIPDYVANSGGVINIAAEYLGKDIDWVSKKIGAIYDRVNQVFEAASELNISSARAADVIAHELVNERRPGKGKETHAFVSSLFLGRGF